MVIYTDNGFSLKSDFIKKIIYTDNSSTLLEQQANIMLCRSMDIGTYRLNMPQ